MVFNVLPSVIFVTLSYSSFWIDRNSVTARTALAITTVLLTIQTYKAMYDSLLPPVASQIWLETYFNGVLAFTVIAMFQFVILNYINTQYLLD